ncbi:MAG: hypothetical protein NTX52_10435, partial [Planctomycetota bacterium]|nr:hypothetical protein [Planctomycetota bacterium]
DDIASSKQKDKDVLLLEPGILRRIGSALGVIGVELVKFDTKSGERLTELGDTISDWVAKTGYETSVEVPLDQFRDLAGNFTEAAKMFDVKVTLTTKK